MSEGATGGPPPRSEPLDAGTFGAWLDSMDAALEGRADADVPCGTCTACCRSSQFVLVEPDDVDAIARIPAALRFPAPSRPAGWVLLGYDEAGRCPMLGEHGCTIYEHRPRACRMYDCRVFTATGTVPDEPEKAPIAERVRRWRFRYASADDEAAHAAVRAVAEDLAAHPERVPGGPAGSTGLAVLAVRAHLAGQDRPSSL